MNYKPAGGPRVPLSTASRRALVSLVAVAVAGSAATLAYAWQTSRSVDRVISERLANMVAVAELDTALLRQRGYVAAYMLDGHDHKWLTRQNRLEPAFRKRLTALEQASHTPAEHALLLDIKRAFENYVAQRNRVVSLCDAGRKDEGRRIYLGDMASAYGQVTAASNKLVVANRQDIQGAIAAGRRGLRRLSVLVTVAALLTIVLSGGLTWLLRTRVFRPLREIARDLSEVSPGDTDGGHYAGSADPADPAALGYYVRTLMSQVKSSREHLARSRKELGHAKRLSALGNAVARLAHEIKNSLLPIGGFARMIEKRPHETKRVVDAAGIIVKASTRLDRMIREVLEFSRPTQSEIRPESVNDVVRDAVEKISVTVPPGIRIAAELDPATPRVPLDPGALDQVVTNLLGNAVEALESSGSIRVKTRPWLRGARIEVSDDGPGIPADVRRQAFEPFFSTKSNGNGLGLAICAQLIADMRGNIRVDSLPGQGSTFTVELPGTDSNRAPVGVTTGTHLDAPVSGATVTSGHGGPA